MTPARFLGALALAAVLAATARADEPLKDPAFLAERLASTTRAIADRHLSFAKKIEKTNPREAWDELLTAIAVCPDHSGVRDKLGFKKDGNVWRGAPLPPDKPHLPLSADHAKQRDKDRKDAASKLAVLAKRAKLGGLEAEWRNVAGLALEEEPDDKQVRELLGHTREKEAWISPREGKIRAAFADAIAKARPGEAKPGPEDEELAKLIGLGELERCESAHLVLLATKAVPDAGLGSHSRDAEATWAAYRYFFAGEDAGFVVDGEPKREATGAKPAPTWKPRWLIVSKDEHPRYIDRALADRKQHEMAKGLSGWTGVIKLSAKNLLVNETRFPAALRSEWVTSGMAEFLTLAQIDQKAKCPPFVLDGIKRFFGGHVSGRADIFYVAAGESGAKRSFGGGSLDSLRARVRELFRGSFEGELRSLLSKGVNELERIDSARALAFVDYMIARERGSFSAFIAALKPEEAPMQTFEKAFGKSVEDVERGLRAWVREEY